MAGRASTGRFEFQDLALPRCAFGHGFEHSIFNFPSAREPQEVLEHGDFRISFSVFRLARSLEEVQAGNDVPTRSPAGKRNSQLLA
jgi:hypothetical protein